MRENATHRVTFKWEAGAWYWWIHERQGPAWQLRDAGNLEEVDAQVIAHTVLEGIATHRPWISPGVKTAQIERIADQFDAYLVVPPR